MAKGFASDGVKFVFVYTREAHPGERYPHLCSIEQKLQHARDMVQRDQIERPMLVDDLPGTLHHAYGRLPNMTYVIGGGGKIVYRAAWTAAHAIRVVLERLVHVRQARRAGVEFRPFYSEWEAMAVVDRTKFVEVLLETAGPRAVTEYLDATEHTMGSAVAKPLRAWWSAQPEALGC